MSRALWSKEQITALQRMYEVDRKSWEDIGAVLGRTAWACRSKMHEVRFGAQKNDFRHQAGIIEQRSVAPAHVIANREARYEAAMRRTQTQAFFGDPAPGFSMLDKKRQAEAARA